MPNDVRLLSNHVLTAVDTYVLPPDARTVTLISATRAGEVRYYEQIMRIIAAAEADGAAVLHDLPQPVTEADLAAATPAERLAVEALQVGRAFSAEMASWFGWREQVEAITPGPQWQPINPTDLDDVRLIGPDVVLHYYEGRLDALRLFHDEPFIPIAAHLVARAMFHARAQAWLPVVAAKPYNSATAEQRVELALGAYYGVPRHQNVVILTGGRTLQRIERVLKANRLTRAERSWLVSGRLPKVWPDLVQFGPSFVHFIQAAMAESIEQAKASA